MKSSPLCQAVHCLLALASLINYSKADTVRATVSINREPREIPGDYNWEHHLEISVDTNGELASVELPERMQIREAILTGEGEKKEADVTCFFYWEKDDSHTQTVSRAFRVYRPFHASKGPIKDFYTRQMLCYYDGGNAAKANTFTLFIENAQGQNELVRLEIGTRLKPAVLELRETHPHLCAGTKVALVGLPALRHREEFISRPGSPLVDEPECETVLRLPLSPGLVSHKEKRMASEGLNSYIPPTAFADQIVCHRNRYDKPGMPGSF